MDAAVFHRAGNRWRLLPTQRQTEWKAYGFWLHRIAASATEANDFGREYGITYRPAHGGPEPTAPLPAAAAR